MLREREREREREKEKEKEKEREREKEGGNEGRKVRPRCVGAPASASRHCSSRCPRHAQHFSRLSCSPVSLVHSSGLSDISNGKGQYGTEGEACRSSSKNKPAQPEVAKK